MNTTPQFWTLRFPCPPDLIPFVEEALSADSAAFSILEEDPQQPIIEVLYDTKPSVDSIKNKLNVFDPALANFNPSLEITSLGNLDWIKEVSANLAPMNIGRWTIFGAAYKDKVAHQETHALQIDATSAFGTGEHPTTRGCLLMLDQILKRFPRSQNWKMLDMGCGSAILAMAFVTATSGHALGIDMDEASVAIARENLTNNNLSQKMQIEVGEGYANKVIQQKAPYDLIMANVFARPLCEMANALKEHLRPGGIAILSGIMGKQANMVASAHRQQGLKVIKRMRLGTWSVLALRRSIRAS